jgi:hypothetical protein
VLRCGHEVVVWMKGDGMREERAEIHRNGLATVVVPARQPGINLGRNSIVPKQEPQIKTDHTDKYLDRRLPKTVSRITMRKMSF